MSKPLSNLKLGFAGLGNMGAPMARHLQEAGEVIVWNRSDGPAGEAGRKGHELLEAGGATALTRLPPRTNGRR